MTASHGSQRNAAVSLRRETVPDPTRAGASVPDQGKAQAAPDAPKPRAKPVAARGAVFESHAFPVFFLMIAALIAGGWIFKDQLTIEAEEGIGYWLGIAGVSCVGLLLLYPVRKRIPGLRFIGSVPAWFHLHMALGLVAPTLILYHAGFRTGSVNAAVALVSMLVVAGSGLLGRMLYVRIHRTLHEKRS